MVYEVDYFDGISSKKQKLEVIVDETSLQIPQKSHTFLLKDLHIPTKIPNVSQVIELPNKAHIKLDKNDSIKTRSHFVFHLENKLRYALLSIVFIGLLVGFSLSYGANASAKFISLVAPENVLDDLSKQTLVQLQKHYLKKTKLSQKTQKYLKNEFTKISPKKLDLKLHFYSSDLFGANAFALPSGDIVLLDDLVELDQNPKLQGILGVLAHEIGHVQKRHSLQNLVKTSIAGAVMAYFMGDFSTVLTASITGLIGLSYSREFEQEADEVAKNILQQRGLSAKALAELFKKLDKGGESKFLSSHPLTKDRVKFFETSN